jgi:FKBP-type peptidyl-prolyl cis-trans isomerase
MRHAVPAALLLAACSFAALAQGSKEASSEIVRLEAGADLPAQVTRLTMIDRAAGNPAGPRAKEGDAVLVHYTGWLYDPKKPGGKGEQFDTSRTRALPFGFLIGAGKVIKGWDLGVVGLAEKAQRTLIIPPHLAYGDKERPRIPANSTLIFDVEVAEIISTAGAAAAPPAPPPVNPVFLKPSDPLPRDVADLHIIELSPGTGKTAESGPVQVHYTGWLYDPMSKDGKGARFDSSVERGQPFGFPLGGRRVIRGWDVGVAGMKEGGKRTLIIPPALGYGARGAGGVIPPNATLIFEVELLKVGP